MSQPGMAMRPARRLRERGRLARDDERPAAAPERGAAAQQRVAVAQAGEGAERELRELVAALARERVELLDVVQAPAIAVKGASMRPCTSASNANVSFGQGEKPKPRFTSARSR